MSQVKPWARGPLEVLKHAIEHLQNGSDKDRRFALIHTDNSIELAARSFILFEKRLVPRTIPRHQWEQIEQNFHELMRVLQAHASNKGYTDELDSYIAFYHDLRNKLYHDGIGISVDSDSSKEYINVASKIFQILFGIEVEIPSDLKMMPSPVSVSDKYMRYADLQTPTNKFLVMFMELEKNMQDLYPRLAYRDPNYTSMYHQLKDFRNYVAHRAVPEEELQSHLSLLERFESIIREYERKPRDLFVYGALMNKEQLARRLDIPHDQLLLRLEFQCARLLGWKRVFDVYSDGWSGGVLNLRLDRRFKIKGIIIKGLSQVDLDRLDRSEGRRYRRSEVLVELKGEKVPVWTYIATETDPSVKPSQKYSEFVLRSAKEWGNDLYDDFVRKTFDATGKNRIYIKGSNPTSDPPSP